MSHIRNPEAYRNACIRNEQMKSGSGAKKYSAKARVARTAGKMFGQYKRLAGHAFTDYAGQAGSLTGRALGRAITGMGDYTLPKTRRHQTGAGFTRQGHNSMGRMGGPRMVKGEKGSMRVQHSEYIGDLVSQGSNPSTFLSQIYGINCGNVGTFPWLSQVANSFQNWKPHKIVWELKTLTSLTAGSSTVVPMGSVMIATQYDSQISAYTNKQQMLESDFAVGGSPSESYFHAVECKSKYNPLGEFYVSPNTNPTTTGVAGDDIRFNNLAYTQFASVNIPNTSAGSLAEIWIHYDIELLKPTLQGQNNAIQSAHYSSTNAANIAGSIFSGGLMVASSTSVLPLTFTSESVTFPLAITEGQFLCVYYGLVAAGTTLTPITSANWSVTNGSITNLWSGTPGGGCGQAPLAMSAAATCLTYVNAFIVNVNAPGSGLCKVTFAGTGLQGSNFTNVDFLVTPLNAQLIT